MARVQQLSFDATPPVQPAAIKAHVQALGQALPRGLHMGTSTWTFPGWHGLIYERQYPQTSLAQDGLRAYAEHPLLRGVGVDRTHYGPVDAGTFAGWAEQVPADFRFLIKAHEACTLARYPLHPRYGKMAGLLNEHFLNGTYAHEVVVKPMVQGLGEHTGPLLFQLAPQDLAPMGGAMQFAKRLARFLEDLPTGPLYAFEVRNPELLTPAYAEVLAAHGAVHCFNLWGRMPSLRDQAHILRGVKFRALVLRWLLHPGLNYEEAVARYKPFDKLVDENAQQRTAIAWLTRHALAAGHEAHIVVNNKAEGCAPLSIIKLAEALVPSV